MVFVEWLVGFMIRGRDSHATGCCYICEPSANDDQYTLSTLIPK